MNSKWRQIAAPIIAQVLLDTSGQPEPIIQRALANAYPFGEKSNHPYAIWLDEIARQRRRGKYAPVDPVETPIAAQAADDAGQLNIFAEENPC